MVFELLQSGKHKINNYLLYCPLFRENKIYILPFLIMFIVLFFCLQFFSLFLALFVINILLKQQRPQHFKVNGKNRYEDFFKFPNDGGCRTKNFPDFYRYRSEQQEKRQNIKNEKTKKYPSPLMLMKERIDRMSTPIQIRNFHDGNITKDFVCNVMNAKHTCKKVDSKEKFIVNPSKDHIIDIDLMAIAAKENGLLNTNNREMTRFQLWSAIRKQIQKEKIEGRDVPLVCLKDKQLEELRNFSYKAEKKLMPSMISTHDEEFWKAVKENKFCSIDTKKLLLDKRWRSFFIESHGVKKEMKKKKK